MSEPVTVEELREAMAFALVEGHTEGGRYLIDTVNGWQVWARVDETGSMMIAQFSTAEFDEQNASLDAKAPDLQRHHTTLLRALDEAMGLLKDLTQSRGWLLGDTERVSVALDNADTIIARYEEAKGD